MLKHFLLMAICAASFNLAYALDNGQQNQMVAGHNQWRHEVGVPDLIWSTSLALSAQSWADYLKNNQGCTLEHSMSMDKGENLYWASAIKYSDGTSQAQQITPAQVTGAWGSEKQYYNYKTNTCATGKVCGHYTQMVWKTTAEVGCGNAECADNSQVWVCDYTPPGNIVGQNPY